MAIGLSLTEIYSVAISPIKSRITGGEKNRDKEIYDNASAFIGKRDEEALIEAAMRVNVIALFQPGFDGHLNLFD